MTILHEILRAYNRRIPGGVVLWTHSGKTPKPKDEPRQKHVLRSHMSFHINILEMTNFTHCLEIVALAFGVLFLDKLYGYLQAMPHHINVIYVSYQMLIVR